MDNPATPKYTIVFERLNEVLAEGGLGESIVELQRQIREIAELAEVVSEPDEVGKLYTST